MTPGCAVSLLSCLARSWCALYQHKQNTKSAVVRQLAASIAPVASAAQRSTAQHSAHPTRTLRRLSASASLEACVTARLRSRCKVATEARKVLISFTSRRF